MDILSRLDIHLANTKEGVIMLACPLDNINDDYLMELERLYSIGTIINSAHIRNYNT